MKHESKCSFRQRRPKPKPPIHTDIIAPPSAVPGYADTPQAGGELGRYLFPVAGLVTAIHVQVDSLQEGEAATVTIEPTERTGVLFRFEVGPGMNVLDCDLCVEAGDRFILCVSPTDVSGVWWAYMFQTGDRHERTAGNRPQEGAQA